MSLFVRALFLHLCFHVAWCARRSATELAGWIESIEDSIGESSTHEDSVDEKPSFAETVRAAMAKKKAQTADSGVASKTQGTLGKAYDVTKEFGAGFLAAIGANATAPGQCTEEMRNPNQAAGKFKPCCAGLEQCLGDWLKNGKSFFVCRPSCEVALSAQDKKAVTTSTGSKGGRDYMGGLTRLTRFANFLDEKLFPRMRPKVAHLVDRPVDNATKRVASPFEHICGGAAMKMNETLGNDGPTQYISFSNGGEYPEVAEDCQQPWDKGQRRLTISGEEAGKQGAMVFDLSNKHHAWQWCYRGGCVKYGSQPDQQICFKGALTSEPWPFACATRAYRVSLRQSTGVPDSSWWTEENRKLIGMSCVMWATRAREVLILPNPRKLMVNGNAGTINVTNDREPATDQCLNGMSDKCVTYNATTKEVCCCSDPKCGQPCQVAGQKMKTAGKKLKTVPMEALKSNPGQGGKKSAARKQGSHRRKGGSKRHGRGR